MLVPAVVSYAVFASRQNLDLVQKDYYEEELRFQHQIDASQRARTSSQPATCAYDGSKEQLMIFVPVPPGQTSLRASVTLYRPSDASLDQTLQLALSSEGTQHLNVRSLRPGLWRVRLSWAVGEQEYFHADSLVVPPRS